jgi:hypothetical protein
LFSIFHLCCNLRQVVAVSGANVVLTTGCSTRRDTVQRAIGDRNPFIGFILHRAPAPTGNFANVIGTPVALQRTGRRWDA